MEEFRDVKGYEGLYQVSSFGRVKSLRCNKDKILKGTVNGEGYFNVGLYKDKKQNKKHIHKLVAIAFIGHNPNGMNIIIDHIDNDKLNNHIDNLQSTTVRHNNSKDKKGFSSKFTGVHWSKRAKKWVSSIKTKGKAKHLGYFNNEIEASVSYQKELNLINKI